MSLLRRIENDGQPRSRRPRRPFPTRNGFLRRKRDDVEGYSRFAKARDREVIREEMKADEEEIEVPIRRNHTASPFQRTPRPEPLLTGWQFVDRVRSNNYPDRFLPNDLANVWRAIEFEFDYDDRAPEGFMFVDEAGILRVQPHREATLLDWMFYTVHLLNHIVLGHFAPPDDAEDAENWMIASEMIINQQTNMSGFNRLPQGFHQYASGSPFARGANYVPPSKLRPERLLGQWQQDNNQPTIIHWCSPAGQAEWDILAHPRHETIRRLRAIYMRDQIKAFNPKANQHRKYMHTTIARAYKWVSLHFPLLSATTAAFTLDYNSAERYDIAIAAVSARDQIIFVNPNKDLTELEWRWVLVHEILHVVLEHQKRLNSRDALLWNVACDYVINNWLSQMGVGVQPEGTLYKAEYAGRDAESIYDEMMENGGNDQIKLVSFRGEGVGDMLDFDPNFKSPSGSGRGRGRFFRRNNIRQMAQNAAKQMKEDAENGLHRGELPGDLVEQLNLDELLNDRIEIPEWKAELAEWFHVRFMPKPPRRSYARRSRRQSAVPDIPLAGRATVEYQSPTFGVVLDTSGSMSHELLQRGLGAVVAFASRHGVAQVRLVMCDTVPYDEGFIDIEKLKKPYQIYGRGGTVLQPSINLLERAHDFPEAAPILIVTDGAIDVLDIQREHAFLLPGEGQLPFEPQGPVFRILGDNPGPFGGRGRFGNAPANSGRRSRPAGKNTPSAETTRALIEKIKSL